MGVRWRSRPAQCHRAGTRAALCAWGNPDAPFLPGFTPKSLFLRLPAWVSLGSGSGCKGAGGLGTRLCQFPVTFPHGMIHRPASPPSPGPKPGAGAAAPGNAGFEDRGHGRDRRHHPVVPPPRGRAGGHACAGRDEACAGDAGASVCVCAQRAGSCETPWMVSCETRQKPGRAGGDATARAAPGAGRTGFSGSPDPRHAARSSGTTHRHRCPGAPPDLPDPAAASPAPRIPSLGSPPDFSAVSFSPHSIRGGSAGHLRDQRSA